MSRAFSYPSTRVNAAVLFVHPKWYVSTERVGVIDGAFTRGYVFICRDLLVSYPMSTILRGRECRNFNGYEWFFTVFRH
jgi:hypothetical protein